MDRKSACEKLEQKVSELEKELESANMKIRAVLETVPAHVNITDTMLNLLDATVDDSLLGRLGYRSKEDIIGRKCHAVFKGSDSPCPGCSLIKCLKSGRLETRLSSEDEDRLMGISTKLYSAPMFDSRGNIVGAVECAVDVTDLRRAEAEVRAANRAKERFLSVIAHDLRNPFNALIGFSELLLSNFEEYDDDRKKKYIGNMAICSRHMHTLLENLLMWSELQTYGIRHEPVKCDPGRICANETDLLKISADRKNIRICLKIGDDESVCADENMLALIFRNLISNAVKFSDTGGEIVISSRDTGEYREFTVSDKGTGISERDIGRIFRTGIRHSSPGTAKERGTGLGLLLCREFAEMNGGRIWAESREGKGSSFRFTVPKWKTDTNI